jgi:hypothetical protein
MLQLVTKDTLPVPPRKRGPGRPRGAAVTRRSDKLSAIKAALVRGLVPLCRVSKDFETFGDALTFGAGEKCHKCYTPIIHHWHKAGRDAFTICRELTREERVDLEEDVSMLKDEHFVLASQSCTMRV